MTTQHTPERLRVATDGSLGSIETESGKSIGQTFQTRPIRNASDHAERIANARRLVACWNVTIGIPTEHIEAAANAVKVEPTWQDLKDQRDDLLAALKDFHAWADNQADAQSKGCHATFDLLMLREQRDIARAAIAKAEGGTA